MTKIKCYAMALALGYTALVAQASHQTSEFDIGLNGRVSMQGSIVSKACDIAMESRYQSVEMPAASMNVLKRAGESITQPFSIHLVNCTFDTGEPDGAPWQFLQVTFDGADDDGLFQVTGEAGGVALEIASKNGDAIHPGQPLSYTEISGDDIKLDYQLRLKINNDTLRPGAYTTVVKYRIDYF
ncbi:fimbrial protein [Cronobacter dublinensis]|uniref:fimbrial protein n=1 Tax=Cronobacter dublinensis TaxID=413497 RepID=UPI0024AFE3A8|nr:fimbrial protein [Cronobacter dublinensis]EKK4080148.1 type 1 fimbrial protein [Cronobacter dublinensis]ELY2735618.1 type 1 fimbrial protein [Cronobacter dublinensis]ELY2907611.1 type 1 fimbrial protein [Cronobacter dublinensis]ELY3771528.1 type 1 fimbrial protein [Cronobacter dublinensis]MDI7492820.1 fimbrial protein [Cronobacter dublinensis]